MTTLLGRAREEHGPWNGASGLLSAPVAEVTQVPDLSVITLSDKPLDVLRPGAAAPDNTILFRVPSPDGGPGFVIPPGLPASWPADEGTLR
jgi:hypothetical protein